MPHIIPLNDHPPKIHDSVWLAETATIIGDVTIAKDCTIWFSTVIRGDVCSITIGEKTNIQDGVIIHGTYKKSMTEIGNEVSVGHGAVLHGCKINDRVLVGMKAVILDNAVIESNVIVAAGAVVLENAHLETGYIYGGVPARKLKKLDPESTQFHITRTTEAYLMYASWYQK